jgi:RNAse (barnase) inhibitor barstar
MTVVIDTANIVDWESFHGIFATAFGFPAFYGRNMNAWIDCMSYLDDPESGMTRVHVPSWGCVTILLEHAGDFAARLPEQYAALIEAAAFVNWLRIERGESSVLALAWRD